jgi:hypothetical protein|tara:strand:- start:5002 stop:5169 length:168 start_codon:yes stop_codon:yes gene_type:complete
VAPLRAVAQGIHCGLFLGHDDEGSDHNCRSELHALPFELFKKAMAELVMTVVYGV